MTNDQSKRQDYYQSLILSHYDAEHKLNQAQSRYDTLCEQLKKNGVVPFKEFYPSFVGKCYHNSCSSFEFTHFKVIGYNDGRVCLVLAVYSDRIGVEIRDMETDFPSDFTEITDEEFKNEMTAVFVKLMSK